jgi:drug/metabolite transporter (DMT)-like permease
MDGYLLRRYRPNEDESESAVGTLILISGFFQAVMAVGMFVLANVLASHGVVTDTPLALPTTERLVALGVGVLEIVWIIPYLYALERSDETRAASLFQTVPLFGLALGLFFFDEVPTMTQIIAGVVLMGGSVLLNTHFHKKNGERLDLSVIGLMCLASFIIALAAFFFKVTALEENYWGTAFWMNVGGFLTGVAMWVLNPSYRKDFNTFVAKHDWKGFGINAVNEVSDSIAILAFYGAVVLGPSTALVQASVAYQPVFILLLGLTAAKLGSKAHVGHLEEMSILQRTVGITIIVLGSIFIFI